MRATHVLVVMGLIAVGAGCSSDDSDQALRDELVAVQAERDELVAQAAAQVARHDAAQRTYDAIGAIWDDPESYGGEAGVSTAIGEYLAPGAMMVDDVFGRISYRQGMINTLFGGSVDPDLVAEMDGYDSWVSADGSQGGSMWVWHGTNAEGNPFELVGLSLVTFDEEGRLAMEVDSYPYPDEYVEEALFGAGTPVTSTSSSE
jgi:hypothetical protein